MDSSTSYFPPSAKNQSVTTSNFKQTPPPNFTQKNPSFFPPSLSRVLQIVGTFHSTFAVDHYTAFVSLAFLSSLRLA